jgi:hypothetical protein
VRTRALRDRHVASQLSGTIALTTQVHISAHLANKPPAGLEQRVGVPGDSHRVGLAPMQHGVREDGVERPRGGVGRAVIEEPARLEICDVRVANAVRARLVDL